MSEQKPYKNLTAIALCMCLVFLPNFVISADKKGEDHRILSRFDGSFIDNYEATDFDRYKLPLGPSVANKEYSESLTLEGKITKIFYIFKGETPPSLLQLYKSYEKVFSQSNAEILFSCFKEECGKGGTNIIVTATIQRVLLNGFMRFGEHAYHAVRVSSEDKQAYIGVYMKEDKGRMFYEIHVIEVDDMNTGNISIADIGKGIEDTGKQAFYGLFFDTGKATLKDSAKAELDLLAEYLKANTDKQFFIVGHTDNTGGYQANIVLSQQRANSVVAALESKYGINVGNLQSVGIGPVSPVSANSSEGGRSQNRRVELVLR